MKKSTKAIILTAITMTFCGCSSCENQYDVYGPGPDIRDNSNDVSNNMIMEIENNQLFDKEDL